MAQFIVCHCGERIPLVTPVSSWEMVCPGCGAKLRPRGPEHEPSPEDDLRVELLGPPVEANGRPGTVEAGDEPQLNPAPHRPSAGRAVDLTMVDVVPPSTYRRADAVPVRVIKPKTRTCRVCGRVFDLQTKICVTCGVDLRTGEALIISDDSQLDVLYPTVERNLRAVSWLAPFGIIPVASEAYGGRKPWVTGFIASGTALISLLFLFQVMLNRPGASGWRDIMLWAGDKSPSAKELRFLYQYSPFGNRDAYENQLSFLIEDEARKQADDPDSDYRSNNTYGSPLYQSVYNADDALIFEAHKAMPVEWKCTGAFQWHQLLTHPFLHANLIHLIVNLIFLLVFGGRVNAVVGNLWMAPSYVVLAVAAGLTHIWSSGGEVITPMIGASGAVMGLAGMYVVFFPRHPLHLAAWARMFTYRFEPAFHLKLFSVKGFWVLGLYFLLDLSAVVLSWNDHVAHFAHLGGCVFGMVLALILVRFRLVDPRRNAKMAPMLGPGSVKPVSTQPV